MKKRIPIYLMLMGLFLALSPVFAQGELRIGAERIDVITRLLEGKRVGLVVNQTSIIEKTQASGERPTLAKRSRIAAT